MIYNGDESRSRTIELISRITNAEKITQSRMPMPPSLTKHLTAIDVAIIRALSDDARKSSVLVAKELGLSSKTVRKRVDRLRKENTILPLPILNIASIAGIIPIYLSYVYSNGEVKTSVDREIISHFDASFIMGSFADPDIGNVVLGASTMGDVPKFLEWAKSQPGIASARVDIATETFMFPEKLIELLETKARKSSDSGKCTFLIWWTSVSSQFLRQTRRRLSRVPRDMDLFSWKRVFTSKFVFKSHVLHSGFTSKLEMLWNCRVYDDAVTEFSSTQAKAPWIDNFTVLRNYFGVILIATVGHTVSHAMQYMQSASRNGSILSVLYLFQLSEPFSIFTSSPEPPFPSPFKNQANTFTGH